MVRLGVDSSDPMKPEFRALKQRIVNVPFQPRTQLPLYLALADLYVQPGRSDDFNDYRFPSKLPEFFAMGRPVILPNANIGKKIVDGEDGILLKTGDALEIASAIKSVLSNLEFSKRLASGARHFFENHLSWQKSAAKLNEFYCSILASAGMDELNDIAAARRVASHYASRPFPPTISYATVRDYSESVDRIRALTSLNMDLKDAQRPWVFKTILSTVKPGARLLEIGAGDPWVADILTRLGYHVVVVDPYDGTARGPDQFDKITEKYPAIEFVRGFFPEALSALEDNSFDCIYSISVLEHLPPNSVQKFCEGIRKHTRSGKRPTIHAIDHVLLGNGSHEHLKQLEQIVTGLGMNASDLHAVIEKLNADADTYFLSAEAHNRWRGDTPYDEFPMRRCVSVQICSTTKGCQLIKM